jgi:REP element-mobilizing transposase RayT/lambda repressor-like predicted transcriptional regulator
MPRKSRIDAVGAVHHVMGRGIEGSRIFPSDADRDQFLERLGGLLQETQALCYAWALIPNHFHLLLRTGPVPISAFMRRLLTGYALWHNRVHRRKGHLFQNRFKSVLCQEEAYLLELVRYIHLNPLRAGLVPDLDALDRYPYCGHSALMGRMKRPWQETEAVLRRFGKRVGAARAGYRAFVEKGVPQGKRPDLSGGGLWRRAGGWDRVRNRRSAKSDQKTDERILGNGEFVARVLAESAEAMERRYALRARGFDLDRTAARAAEVLGLDPQEVWAPGKYRRIVRGRSLLCYWAVRALGVSMATLSRRLGISIPAVSASVVRGQRIAAEEGFVLEPGAEDAEIAGAFPANKI